MNQLSRLRLVFIIYILVKISFDIAAGGRIISGLTSSFSISPETYYAFAIGINLLIILIGLLLFYYLLDKRNWARIVLLIIGWLAVADFFSGLLFSSRGIELLTRIDSATNWNAIIQIDRVTDFISLIFWSYAIFILQFNTEVRKLFLCKTEVSKPREEKTKSQ